MKEKERMRKREREKEIERERENERKKERGRGPAWKQWTGAVRYLITLAWTLVAIWT